MTYSRLVSSDAFTFSQIFSRFSREYPLDCPILIVEAVAGLCCVWGKAASGLAVGPWGFAQGKGGGLWRESEAGGGVGVRGRYLGRYRGRSGRKNLTNTALFRRCARGVWYGLVKNRRFRRENAVRWFWLAQRNTSKGVHLYFVGC